MQILALPRPARSAALKLQCAALKLRRSASAIARSSNHDRAFSPNGGYSPPQLRRGQRSEAKLGWCWPIKFNCLTSTTPALRAVPSSAEEGNNALPPIHSHLHRPRLQCKHVCSPGSADAALQNEMLSRKWLCCTAKPFPVQRFIVRER